jgi:hypothetical protein
MLQGTTMGTIGPMSGDATVITGVNTSGIVRVNNLANLGAIATLSGPIGNWLTASARDANLVVFLIAFHLGGGLILTLLGVERLVRRTPGGLKLVAAGLLWTLCGVLQPLVLYLAIAGYLLWLAAVRCNRSLA